MNRRFHLKFFFALLLIAVHVISAPAELKKVYVTAPNGESLGVLDKADIQRGDIIGYVPNRAAVELVSLAANGWAKIRFADEAEGSLTGYVPIVTLSYDQYGRSPIQDPTGHTDLMYVNTLDGDALNVRMKPELSIDTLIGCISNHTPVNVVSIDDDGWAKIKYITEEGIIVDAYVYSRYLSYDEQGLFRSGKSKAPVPTSVPAESEDNSLEELNAELRTTKTIADPFTVLVHPSRPNGRVNLRWAPSNKVQALVSYPADKALTVIGETTNWYQVQDPEQGYSGFIHKKQVTVLLPDSEE